MSRQPFVLLLSLIAWPLLAQEAPKATVAPPEITKQLNITYNPDKDADPVRHKLDVYLPKDVKKFPMMMFVHGGSWNSGSKDLYGSLGQTFAQQGIGTVIINYRLSRADNNVKHPDHIKDVAKAFAWMKANAAKLGGDEKKLYVSGHSAGGHLVSLLATDDQYLKAEKCSVADISGVMPISGVYAITSIVPVFHRPFGKEDEMCKAASPVTHVKGSLPPFLVSYADADFLTLDKMAEDFGKKLKELKNEVTVMKLEKRNHFSIIINLAVSAQDPLTKAMVGFVTKK
ncbi:alpha/beta hydrolase [Zavarzinella formosa]|uniref:alpha/beta hydrolase n=1 Tax=Zavarzinella formosa TaxID=360055 RepID=UPI0012F9DD5D|nr:alpha/beta hydrolase [Zavarzinella formosa]